MGKERDLIDIEFDNVKEYDRVYTFQIENESVTLPKCHCAVNDFNNIVSVPKWLARNKDLYFD